MERSKESDERSSGSHHHDRLGVCEIWLSVAPVPSSRKLVRIGVELLDRHAQRRVVAGAFSNKVACNLVEGCVRLSLNDLCNRLQSIECASNGTFEIRWQTAQVTQ